MPPPIDSFVISDDEEPDPQQIFSRDLASLDEEIKRASETVKGLDAEVILYTDLLKAAQNRLHKSREQKEQLIDNKQKLLDKKLRFLQLGSVTRSTGNPVDVRSKKIRIKTERSSTAANIVEVDQTIRASHKSDNSSRKALSSCPTPTLVPHLVQESPLLPLSPDDETSPLTSDYDLGVELELDPQYPLRAASGLPGANLVANSLASPSKELGYFHTTALDDDDQSLSTSQRGKSQGKMKLRGRGSRRFYGGGLSGVRLGASICSRIPDEHDSEEERPQKIQGKKSRAMIYSPYWEASDSEPGPGNDLGQPLADTALATQTSLPLQNTPTNPETHSRIEISSVIGGKTQGTWCTINPNKATAYNAGSYMALDRGLNHLLLEHPGENGGVYVADWLRKEVGKSYQVFIKRASNNWLLHGKYLVAAIREVSLNEWQSFDDKDKNRWAEHMLEHQWGKNILQKKKLFTESQCTKSNWVKVLSFFNRHDRPNLRLKVLELRFISYDRGLYDALVSASSVGRKKKRKRHSSEYDDEDDIWDE